MAMVFRRYQSPCRRVGFPDFLQPLVSRRDDDAKPVFASDSGVQLSG